MAAFIKFDDFVEQLGKGDHHLDTDALKVFLTNEAPISASDTGKSDMADLATGNGYTSGGSAVTVDFSETAGTAALSGTDVVWTATGAGFGPFQYVVLYNDSHAASALIGYWNYGSSISCNAGETFTVDFGATILTIT